MKTSETLTKIAPALLAAQKAIGNATKNAKNPHFKNNYADLGAVIEAVKEPLNANGIIYQQSLTERYFTSSEGTTVLSAITTRLTHESGEWIEDTAISPLSKADPQGVGSATTYLRRYSLAAICGITQEDDDGEAARPAPITAEQKAKLTELEAAPATNERVKAALKHYNAHSIGALNKDQAERIITKLTA